MARVTMDAPALVVQNKDVVFEVRENEGEKILGKLKISRGTVEWLPSNHQYGYHVSWTDFDKMLRNHGHKKSR